MRVRNCELAQRYDVAWFDATVAVFDEKKLRGFQSLRPILLFKLLPNATDV